MGKNAPERSHIGSRKTLMMAWKPWVESIRQAKQEAQGRERDRDHEHQHERRHQAATASDDESAL